MNLSPNSFHVKASEEENDLVEDIQASADAPMEQVPNDNESAVQVSILHTRVEPQADEVLEKMLTQLLDEIGIIA